MKINCLVSLLSLCLFLGSCQKKELDIIFREEACIKLSINGPLYSWIKDPSCGAATDSAILKITFNHPNQKKCIDEIFPEPVFYNKSQQIIKNVTYSGALKSTDPDVTIGEDQASFIVRAKFSTVQEANSLNNIYLKFHTENKLDDKSKTTSVRVNGGCAVVIPSSYKVVDTVAVTSEYVQVFFFDDATEDQDVISVYLNGVWVLENYSLTNKGETFTFRVKKGKNDLVLFAVNEGKVGPNTCALKVNNGKQIDMQQDLNTGDAISIQF